jgi:hypothetical protein
LSLSNSFAILPVKEPSDDKNNGTFQIKSGSELDILDYPKFDPIRVNNFS